MGLFKRILSCLVIILLVGICSAGAKENKDFLLEEEKILAARDLGFITEDMAENCKVPLKREGASIILFNLYAYFNGDSDIRVENILRDTKLKEANGAYVFKLMDGYSKIIFAPSLSVKREEFARYLYNTLNTAGMNFEGKKDDAAEFSDKESIDPLCIEAVLSLANYGIIEKNEEEFRPKDKITVEEATYMAVNACEFFSEKYIEINGKKIKIGTGKDELLDEFGKPDKTYLSEYNSEKYVYFLDTGYFSVCMNSQGEAEEIFTNSTDFEYYTIDSETSLSDLKYADPDLTYKYRMKDDYTHVNVYFDSSDLRVDGILIRSNEMYDYVLKIDEFHKSVIKEELIDIINCSRKRYGLEEYVLNEKASETEAMQCGYMSMKACLTHDYADGLTFLERFSEKEINFLKASENIAYNTMGAADIFYYWTSIPGMRGNIYSSEFKNMGAGCLVLRNVIYAAVVFYV